jgi:hypothetical protein
VVLRVTALGYNDMTFPIHVTGTATLAVFCLIPTWVIYKSFNKQKSRRPELVPPSEERILIVGASSGIGRVLALKYAERGAKVCVVARRSAELELVQSECENVARIPDAVFSVCADFTDAEALITIRNKIEESESCCLISGLTVHHISSHFSCQSGTVLILWSFRQECPLYAPSWR